MRMIGTLLLAVALLASCGANDEEASPTAGASSTLEQSTTTTLATTTSQSTTTTTAVEVLKYPSGDPVVPGYPLIVPIETIDERVASWLEDSVNARGEVVAVAPGVYTPYNSRVPDLAAYLDVPTDGDCLMRDTFFPDTGGTCWSGVQPGTAEPPS